MAAPPIVYSLCPGCHLVTAPAWALREGEPAKPVPVTISCGNCGTEYTVTDPAKLHTELDAELWHDRCRTALRCPSVAHVARCSQRGPDVVASSGCGDLIPGPAAGGPSPPGPDAAPPTLPAAWRTATPSESGGAGTAASSGFMMSILPAVRAASATGTETAVLLSDYVGSTVLVTLIVWTMRRPPKMKVAQWNANSNQQRSPRGPTLRKE